MNQTMTYEKLYTNMVKKFTVEKDNTDYNLGDFMLMKAAAKKNAMIAAADSKLPVARDNKNNALTTGFSYVHDKLTVKQAPVRHKTIRSFPFRTSLTAFGSALVVCALAVSCCFFGLAKSANGTENIVTVTETENQQIEENNEDTAIYSTAAANK